MSTKNITTIINKTAISAEYECEYYHPVHDEQIFVAPTKTLEVNGEEVGKIQMYLLDPTWFTSCLKNHLLKNLEEDLSRIKEYASEIALCLFLENFV